MYPNIEKAIKEAYLDIEKYNDYIYEYEYDESDDYIDFIDYYEDLNEINLRYY